MELLKDYTDEQVAEDDELKRGPEARKQENTMKRYTPMNDDSSGQVESEPDEDPNGDWVRHDDALAAVKEARRKLLLDLWDALPGHEATGDPLGTLRGTLLMSEVGDEIRVSRMHR